MADGDGAVLVEQQHGHGLAHNVAAADDHAALALHGDVIGLQQLHDAGGGAGQEVVVPHHDFAYVVGVEGVHVLLGVDGLHHGALVQALGQGGLHQNAVDVLLVVEGVHQSQQFLLGGGGGQGVLLGVDARGLAGLFLVVHVDAGGRVLPHNDHGQAGADALPLQGGHLLGHLFLHLGGDRLSIHTCRHIHSPSFQQCFMCYLVSASLAAASLSS